MHSLGSRFKCLRESRNITQEELATLADIGRTTVSALEHDIQLKFDTLRTIAKPLKLSDPEWLSLVVEWIHAELGVDFAKLTITTGYGDNSTTDIKHMLAWFYALPTGTQQEIEKLLRRADIVKVAPILNGLLDLHENPPKKKTKIIVANVPQMRDSRGRETKDPR